jgi:hypothetical protein
MTTIHLKPEALDRQEVFSDFLLFRLADGYDEGQE